MALEAEKELTRRCCAAFGPGGLEDYLKLYGPDAVVHGYGAPLAGLPAIRAFYEAFLAAFGEVRLHVDRILGEEDLVALSFHLDLKHTGPFMGVPATGRSVQLPGQTLLRFREGRVVERWSTADFLGLLVQLGAIPAPA